MKPILLISFLLLLLTLGKPALADARFWGFEDARKGWFGHVWEEALPDFEEKTYKDATESLLKSFEEKTGRRFQPGERRKAGIKVYASSGPGLRTPPYLVKAVIEALLERGYSRSELFILGSRESGLRESGFLPPLSMINESGPYFQGVEVRSMDDFRSSDPLWFYDSPLPLEFTSPLGREVLGRQMVFDSEEARKSFLPKSLLLEVDFWINLPVLYNLRAVGVSGALSNATIWNVTNHNRFLNSPANAPVAVAEMAAIPELLDSWACTILSLESYQVIGGPIFNAYYTLSAPRLWLSADPVILDAHGAHELSEGRQAFGFSALPEYLPLFEFASELELGHAMREQTIWHR